MMEPAIRTRHRAIRVLFNDPERGSGWRVRDSADVLDVRWWKRSAPDPGNMTHLPSLDEFRQLARDHQLVPVYRRLISDTLTPVSAFRRLDRGSSACLFESVVGGEKVGRYSFLAVDPFLELRAQRQRVQIVAGDEVQDVESLDPLEELRLQLRKFEVAHLEELPPFVGGAVGYAAYDVVRYAEHLPDAPEDDRGLPDLCFGLYDQIVVFDNVSKTMFVIALARLDQNEDPDAAYADARNRVDQLVEQLLDPVDDLGSADISAAGEPSIAFASNFTKAEFEESVRKCVDYIRAGDIFQVVISQRLALDIVSQPFEIYRTLRVVNPSPFMFFLRTSEATLVGSSPEIMCRVVDGKVTLRPLAGTRRRGVSEAHDRQLAEELLADPKERAEHVMLVDLGRNDVGRVTRYGSVELSDVMVIERYSHVMHITSNVVGELADDRDAFDALRACLPAGTVSGAPKVRAMQIISELEPNARGAYCGSLGYIGFDGTMDLNILIRTITAGRGWWQMPVGGGIVAQSDPLSEYEETWHKAEGLLRAL